MPDDGIEELEQNGNPPEDAETRSISIPFKDFMGIREGG